MRRKEEVEEGTSRNTKFRVQTVINCKKISKNQKIYTKAKSIFFETMPQINQRIYKVSVSLPVVNSGNTNAMSVLEIVSNMS